MAAPLAAGTPTAAPLYKEVKRLLTGSLQAREWQPGEALPSETRLAQHFHVSIGTLRKAVDELVAEQVLVRQQGRGTFVATHGPSRLMFQFFRIVRSDGEKQLPEPELLGFERDRAGAHEAAALEIQPGDRVLRVRNLLRLGGEPIVLDDIVLAQRLFPDLGEKAFRERDSTIYNLYQTRYGINVVRASERLRATAADRVSARILKLEPGAPLLEIHRVAMTYHSSPVELRRSLVNTRHHAYSSELGKGQAG
ncbi:MAG TPA: GntR family transcriptional regulator [Burkholderiales bacterium]|nr:GntR family transcriptional regulator [Burkholderiales bacterium]